MNRPLKKDVDGGHAREAGHEAGHAGRRETGSAGERDVPPPGLSPSVHLVDGRRAANFNEYTPALIGMVYNRLSSGASKLYRARFGIGIAEWRVVGLAAAQPGLPASRISDITGMDKAAVSRALAKLDEAGYVSFEADANDERRKTWSLSEEGHRLHGEILDLALERERVLMTGISPQEAAQFNAMARRMLANLPMLDGIEDENG